jgi:LPXTG-site transpeptidase (sortase) family protein
VGVEANGDMEIPGVREVGWYRFGSRPGDPGSAVLAAHVAYDGVDGVFRHLGDLRAGDAVEVGLDDGTVRRFVVTDLAQYPKTDLPAEVFARGGDPRLVLVTCGGEFDPGARHYEDNVVAYARPTG